MREGPGTPPSSALWLWPVRAPQPRVPALVGFDEGASASRCSFTRRPGTARARQLACQATYRRRYHSTVRFTASDCGVGSNGPKARWNFDASETNGRSNC
jgi:hypothetical protein